MNKQDLVAHVAAQAGVDKKVAEKVLDATTSQIATALAGGDEVRLIGFGTFSASKRAAREGRNPATGAKIKIAATTLPKFSAGAVFKQAVAAGKAPKKVKRK